MSVFDFIIRFKSDGVDQMANTVSGKIHRSLQQAGSAAAAYVSVGAIKARVGATVQYVTSIKDLSEQTSISTDRLQEFEYAANRMGMSIQDVITPFNRLKLAREAALSGKSGNQDAADFAALGISANQLKSMSPEQTFIAVGNALSKVSDAANTAQLSVNFFGREGIRFTNALKNGFMESADQAKELGIVIGEGLVNQIDVAEKRMALFNKRARRVGAGVIGGGMGVWDDVNSFAQGIFQEGWQMWYNVKKAAFNEAGAKDVGGKLLKEGYASPFEALGEGAMLGDNAVQNEELALARELARAKAKARKGSGLPPRDTGLPRQKADSGGGGSQSQADALARIGLFRGGAGPSQTTLLQTQIKQLTQVVEQLKSVNGNLTDES